MKWPTGVHQFKRQPQAIGRLCHASGLQLGVGVWLRVFWLKNRIVNALGVLLDFYNILRVERAPVGMASPSAYQGARNVSMTLRHQVDLI